MGSDLDYIFKAYVVNTAAYDAGDREDSGAWLYFPSQEGEAAGVLEQIGLSAGADPREYFMDSYVSRVQGLEPLLPMYGDLRELDALARALAGLSPEDREVLAAVQESPYRLTTLEQLREFPRNTDCYILDTGVKDLAALGWSYFEEHADIPLTPAIRAAIAPVPIGAYAMERDRGCFTSRGYLYPSDDEWQHERPQEAREDRRPSIRERLEQSRKECMDKNKAQAPRRGKPGPEL